MRRAMVDGESVVCKFVPTLFVGCLWTVCLEDLRFPKVYEPFGQLSNEIIRHLIGPSDFVCSVVVVDNMQ
jgi:hypothetical protein